jgi:hypothetical protein
MSGTRRSCPSGASQGRRAGLKLALGVGPTLRTNLVGAQNDDPRKARPQTNDRSVFARAIGKGQTITVADLPAGAAGHRLPD